MTTSMFNRRRLLATLGSAAFAGGIARPYLSRAADRPVDHPRHPVRRRVGRFRDGLGARRPAVAHAGRSRDHRQLQDHPQRPVRRCAAGQRLHRQGAARRPAGRAGHFLSHPLCRSVRADHPRRADDRPLSHRAGRPPLGVVRLVGRHRRAGLGHRRGARRHAHLRDDAEEPARLLHPQRRHHLRRRADCRPR